MSAGDRRFADDEVNEILRRAIAREQATHAGVGREEIIAAAEEVGIARADVEAALREFDAEAHEQRAKSAMDLRAGEDLRAKQRRRVRSFVRHFGIYLAVNVPLFLLNVFFTPSLLWFLVPVLGWGIAILIQLVVLLVPPEPQPEKESKRRRREREREERRRQHNRHFEENVERAVQQITMAIGKWHGIRVEPLHSGERRVELIEDDDLLATAEARSRGRRL
jgi:hypothetical protein